MNGIRILDYQPEHQPFFEAFNRAWIEELFEMEPVDEWVLANPDKAIIEPGGAILMAEYNGVVAGTVGLRKLDDHLFEFTKMAVDKNFRRLGIAEALSYASFEKAKALGATTVVLYSNTRTAAAIKLYEKIGFKHIEVENSVYKRANVKMEIDVSGQEAVIIKQSAVGSRQSPVGISNKMRDTVITQADVSHAGIIEIIGKMSFRAAFEHLFNSKEELSAYLERIYDPVKLTRSIRKENNIYLLAWQEGKPVGFAKIKKHSLNEQIGSVSQMELQKIYVLPEYQGSGAGRALMMGIEDIAAAIHPDYIWLDTHISNEKAIRLYENKGFKKIGKYFFTIGTQTFEYYVLSLALSDGLCLTIKNGQTETVRPDRQITY